MLNGPMEVMTEQAQIIDRRTVQKATHGFAIIFSWSNAENMYVTNSGEISGMESATIDEATNGQSYINLKSVNEDKFEVEYEAIPFDEIVQATEERKKAISRGVRI